MWWRFSEFLTCIKCQTPLEPIAIEERAVDLETEHLARGEDLGIPATELSRAVETGLLVCNECRLWFPVDSGLPVLLPYEIETHRVFSRKFASALNKLGHGYRCLNETPVTGEEFVRRSFSKQWSDYDFDGVIWAWTYEDREALFLAEMGDETSSRGNPRFLEVGCGIGVVTSFATTHFGGDAVGVDLGHAATKAARHFQHHPFLHFAQASLWQLPFPPSSFDLVYSHGVLMHTNSTEGAFRSIAPLCKPGGRLYVWVSGVKGTTESLSRRVSYAVERVLQPVLARSPSPVVTAVLAPIATGYMFINFLQRRSGRKIQPYDFTRAMHAARDRLTPAFAHRTDASTVEQWFYDTGYESLHHVGSDEVPEALQPTWHRNVAIRGTQAQSAP